MKRLTPLLAALVLAGCAATPAYGPAGDGGYGYADQIIETGRYRVSFRARSADAAENGALRRAAEIAAQQGFDHFTVVSRDLEREVRRSGSSIGIGGGTGGVRSGVGVGVSVPLGGGNQSATARLEVVMGNGPRPDDPRSYDTASTLRNLRGDFASGN